MADSISRDEESTRHPQAPAETGEARSTLEAMTRRLRQHSALEDLGPLFGPEAQGKEKA